jgi:DNA-binding transcriptional LysR family regulator
LDITNLCNRSINATRLTLRQLQIFVAIANSGGTTAGADALALSQSATSAALIELENVLGTRLFDRVGKRLILNDSGRALLPNARSVLQSTSAIAAEFGANGEFTTYNLRISASTTIANYILPAVIAKFYALHPATQIEVDVGNTSDVVAAVEAFDADVGFIEAPCLRTSVTVIPWMLDELVVVCAPGHELAKGGAPAHRLAGSAARSPLAVSRARLGHARSGRACAAAVPAPPAPADAARQRGGHPPGGCRRAGRHLPVAPYRRGHAAPETTRAAENRIAETAATLFTDLPTGQVPDPGPATVQRVLPGHVTATRITPERRRRPPRQRHALNTGYFDPFAAQASGSDRTSADRDG